MSAQPLVPELVLVLALVLVEAEAEEADCCWPQRPQVAAQ